MRPLGLVPGILSGLLVAVPARADVLVGISEFPFQANEGQAFSAQALASFTDSGPGAGLANLVAAINWGDGSASSVGTVLATSGGYVVYGSHLFAEEGTFLASVTISNTVGLAQSTMSGIAGTVMDAALTGAARSFGATAGTAYSGTLGSFSDSNPGATASDFTVSINWGDPGAASAGTVLALGGGDFAVQGTHRYVTANTYAVTLGVTDTGGSTATIDSTANVAAPATVSEPGSRLLLLAGLAALLPWRRRRRAD